MPAGEVLVVLLANGHLVRVDEDLTLEGGRHRAAPGRAAAVGQPGGAAGSIVLRDEQGRAERIAGTLARRSGARTRWRRTKRGGSRGGGGLAGMGSTGSGDVGAGSPSSERTVRGEVSSGTVDAEGGDGSIAQDAVAKRLRASYGSIRACYERGLRTNPALAGRVTVRFTVAPSGRVTQATVEGFEDAPEVAACVGARFRTLLFPAPTGGAVELSVPMVLRSSQ